MTTTSAALLLMMLMDPLGNLPVFSTVLKDVAPDRRRRVLVRELGLALAFLVCFLFLGRYLFGMLHLSEEAVGIAGGLILGVIGFRMLFPGPGGVLGDAPGGEPFLVPLAIPMIAGPSTLSLVLLLSSTHPERSFDWLLALFAAWTVVALVLSMSGPLGRLLKASGLEALQRVMGMLLICLSVQMFVNGLRGALESVVG